MLSQVTGAIGWRCRSETDMSAAASRDETGKLLTPGSQPHSSSFNTHHVHWGRSGNLRRSRHSPSSSPSLAAQRELSALLGSSGDLVVSRRRGLEDTRRPLPRGSGLSPTKAWDGRNPESIDEALKDVSKDQDLVKDSRNSRADPSCSSQEELPNNPTMFDSRNQSSDQTSYSMSVLLEKCTLVPELKVFKGPATRTSHSEVSLRHNDAVTPGLEDKGAGEAQSGPLETEKKNAEEPEVKVIVWCVTGVCEASGENAHPRTEEDRKVPGEEQQTSCVANVDESSDSRSDGETTESVPISSQPVSVSRHIDPALPASSPGLHPTKPASVNQEKEEETANQVAEEYNSTNQRADAADAADAAAGSQQTSDEGGVCTKTSKRRMVEGSSTKTKPEVSTSSSSRKILNTITGSAGIKPLTSTSGRLVRTLTTSENQNMRRVVPITRVSPASSSRNPERPPAHSRASSRPAGPNASSSSIRRGGERPKTAPPCQQLTAAKTAGSKEPRKLKASGSEQNQNPAVRNPVMKPRTEAEEKMCVSKLRSLNREGRVGSASAPVTPLHKSRTATPSSSTVPGFTRNTASSSFRSTRPPLQPSSTSPKPSSSSSSSPLRRPHSSRSSAPSPLHNSLVPPRVHRRNDSGSDKSAHSRDSGKPSRPSWR